MYTYAYVSVPVYVCASLSVHLYVCTPAYVHVGMSSRACCLPMRMTYDIS